MFRDATEDLVILLFSLVLRAGLALARLFLAATQPVVDLIDLLESP